MLASLQITQMYEGFRHCSANKGQPVRIQAAFSSAVFSAALSARDSVLLLFTSTAHVILCCYYAPLNSARDSVLLLCTSIQRKWFFAVVIHLYSARDSAPSFCTSAAHMILCWCYAHLQCTWFCAVLTHLYSASAWQQKATPCFWHLVILTLFYDAGETESGFEFRFDRRIGLCSRSKPAVFQIQYIHCMYTIAVCWYVAEY